MKKKVVIAQPVAAEGTDLLIQAGFEIVKMPSYSPELLSEAASEAQGILIRNGVIPGWVIENCKTLQVIGRHGVGVETIDVEAATRCGVQVTNAPLANSQAVAEHVITLVMALAKRLLPMHQAVLTGDFDMRHRDLTIELEGKTISVLGLGNIGKRIARCAHSGLGMKVLGYDPYLTSNDISSKDITLSSWKMAFEQADFVSVNMPLNPTTEGIIGRSELETMKPGAFIINCARSQIIDNDALLKALEKGTIAGAAIDVYPSDPPPQDYPLLKAPNLLCTPHNAAHTEAAMQRMAMHAAQGIIEVLRDKPPSWPVNKPQKKGGR